jgi:hypothetical protein
MLTSRLNSYDPRMPRVPFMWGLICSNLLLAGGLLLGCSGQSPGSGQGSPSPTPVAITTQPVSQTVPIGRTATFTVAANGAGPISYQWSKNGAALEGATTASYTTPLVTLADSGSTFQVTVGNGAGSATSSTATLTAGPRAPAIGDLRYLEWEQVTESGLGGYDRGVATNVNVGMSNSYSNAVGTPPDLGSGENCYPGVEYDCAWRYLVEDLPVGMTGLSVSYQGGVYSSLSSDLQSIVAANVVIDCLDLEPANNAYAVSWVQTAQTGGFDYRWESIPPSQLASTVAADGVESRVITAVSIDTATGAVDLISYGWQGDTTTTYETQTAIVTPQNVASTAGTMANQGYFISAFGGNDTSGYALVGMRVQGDTMPRPVSITVGNNSAPASNPDTAYFTTVVLLDEIGGDTLVTEQ